MIKHRHQTTTDIQIHLQVVVLSYMSFLSWILIPAPRMLFSQLKIHCFNFHYFCS